MNPMRIAGLLALAMAAARAEAAEVAAGDDWHAQAQKRIEVLRRSEVRLRVLDAAGRPVAAAECRLRMTRHAFPFGTAVGDRAFAIASTQPADGPGRFYAEFKTLFNGATLEGGLRWAALETPARRAQTERIVNDLKRLGVHLRGHTLVYGGWEHLPPRLRELEKDPEALRAEVRNHVKRTVEAFKGRIDTWDVLNEPWSHQTLTRILGEAEMAEWFRIARAADPNARLVVNENNIISSGIKLEPYLKIVRRLIDDKAPLDAVGVQSHFRASRFDPQTNPPPSAQVLWERLEKVAALGLPIEITEFDVFNDKPDAPVQFSDDDQARITRDMLYVAFSHPKVVAFFIWGFWDGSHWMNNAPIYTRDWQVKPSGRVWLDLVRNKWWTNEQGRTDAEGRFAASAYHGEHELTVRLGERTATRQVRVRPGEAAVVEVVLE